MTANVDCLGRGRSFVKGLLAKTRSLHKDTIPERKNGPGRLAIIVSHALNGLNQCAKKKSVLHCLNINQEVSEYGRPWRPLDCPPILACFCSPKNHGFHPFYWKGLPFFSWMAHCISYFAWKWYHWIGLEKDINRYRFFIFLFLILNIS